MTKMFSHVIFIFISVTYIYKWGSLSSLTSFFSCFNKKFFRDFGNKTFVIRVIKKCWRQYYPFSILIVKFFEVKTMVGNFHFIHILFGTNKLVLRDWEEEKNDCLDWKIFWKTFKFKNFKTKLKKNQPLEFSRHFFQKSYS